MSVVREKWGVMPDGTQVDLFTMTNDVGMEAGIATYGGVITRLLAPDRNGLMGDVTLGYDTLDEYLVGERYFGCIVGRVANRIRNGLFTLDGTEYALDCNNGAHHLHGGRDGFHMRVWQAEAGTGSDGPQVKLTRRSEHGEQGYPGALDAEVTYTLLDDGLRIDLSATAHDRTIVSMTSHGYFNLSDEPGADCLDHRVEIPAGRCLAVDGDLVPTGGYLELGGTPLDFRSPATIGSRIDDGHEALAIGRGYDHYYVLDAAGTGLRLATRVAEPASGRVMEVRTTCPGLQFYSGNHIPDSLPGRDGAVYGWRSGFCLEPHGYVDAPNQPEFPPITIEPGETRTDTILYTFTTK